MARIPRITPAATAGGTAIHVNNTNRARGVADTDPAPSARPGSHAVAIDGRGEKGAAPPGAW